MGAQTATVIIDTTAVQESSCKAANLSVPMSASMKQYKTDDTTLNGFNEGFKTDYRISGKLSRTESSPCSYDQGCG